jgi:hypothetical protein
MSCHSSYYRDVKVGRDGSTAVPHHTSHTCKRRSKSVIEKYRGTSYIYCSYLLPMLGAGMFCVEILFDYWTPPPLSKSPFALFSF